MSFDFNNKFYISDHEYFMIDFGKKSLAMIRNCDEVHIVFIGASNFVFGSIDIGSFCSTIRYQGEKVLNNVSIVPSDIHTLGIACDEYFMGIIDDSRCMDYYLFGNSHTDHYPHYSSWLYNNQKHEIIFEITSDYPWFGKEENPDYMPYDLYMQTYTFVVQKTVDRMYVIDWLQQVDQLKSVL